MRGFGVLDGFKIRDLSKKLNAVMRSQWKALIDDKSIRYACKMLLIIYKIYTGPEEKLVDSGQA